MIRRLITEDNLTNLTMVHEDLSSTFSPSMLDTELDETDGRPDDTEVLDAQRKACSC